MKIITVLKRDGTREPLALEKWQTQIAKVCAGIADVSQSMIEIRTQLHFYDGITTKEIENLNLHDFGIFLELEPEEEEKAAFERNVQIALQSVKKEQNLNKKLKI